MAKSKKTPLTPEQRKARRRIQRMIIREENTSDDPFGLHAMARKLAKQREEECDVEMHTDGGRSE